MSADEREEPSNLRVARWQKGIGQRGLTFAEKTLRKLPAARAMMPEGDFRDWTDIEVWARSIAEELTQLDAGHVEVDP